jgi:hypothetical protein
MRICLFVSSDFNSHAVLEEAFAGVDVTYLAYMSRGCAADACIKAFALSREIMSCPFACSGFEQLTGMGAMFDKCVVIRRSDDYGLENLAVALARIFKHVEVICYVAHPKDCGWATRLRKLSAIVEE